MKIIHCADIHLGSKLESKFSKEISDKRKSELLNTFSRMIDYAKDNDIKIILLSGDIFDKDKPIIKDKEFFYNAIKQNSDIDFFYLKGNHDIEGAYSESIPNLKTFNSDNFITYSYDNIDITGIELSSKNEKSFYSKLNLNKDKINIVMLHGEATNTTGKDKIKLDNLKNKGIDYLALGHIHAYKSGLIDERGTYAYSGCLEPRGFDECGDKGFIELDITDKVNYKFIPFSKRKIIEIDVDISKALSLYSAISIIKKETSLIEKSNILRINLIGELTLGLEIDTNDIKEALSDYFFLDVKNKTSIMIDSSKYENDKSLIGVFVKNILNNNDYTEEEKKKLINMGLNAINGKDILI